MKIKDAVARINKSDPQEVNLDELFCEFDLPHYGYQIDSHDFRLYWLQTWMNSGTRLGISAVFHGDEFIAIRVQHARKSPVLYSWVSHEIFSRIRVVLTDLVLKCVVVYPELQNLEQNIDEFYTLEFSSDAIPGTTAYLNGAEVRIKRIPIGISYIEYPKVYLYSVVIEYEDNTEETVDIRDLVFRTNLKPIE